MSMPVLATDIELVKDMISFDRGYIPALAMTSQNKVEPSRKALKILKGEWEQFKGKYYDSSTSDENWKASMDSIEESVLEALDILARGGSLSEVHEAVEGIRFTLLQMRERKNIDYFVDHLTRFHDPMEMILTAAAGKTPEILNETDLERIRSKLPDALKLWEKVVAFDLEPSLYGFDQEKMQTIRAAFHAEREALVSLAEVLENGNKADIIKGAANIKPNFAKVFMQFGDFESLKNR